MGYQFLLGKRVKYNHVCSLPERPRNTKTVGGFDGFGYTNEKNPAVKFDASVFGDSNFGGKTFTAAKSRDGGFPSSLLKEDHFGKINKK